MSWPVLFPKRASIYNNKSDKDCLAGQGAIPVLRLTGPAGVGKTSFIMRAIAAKPGEPSPIIGFDYEDGISPYTSNYSLRVVDMTKGTPTERHERFIKTIKEIEPGEFAAALIDPAEDWEDDLGEHIIANPSKYGYSAPQLMQRGKPSFLYWGALKATERDLLIELLNKVEIVVIVNHLAQRFINNEPVAGQYDPKGKKTLGQLATVTAYLVGNGQCAPAGYIVKSRLEVVDWAEVDQYGVPTVSKALLPQFMPEFTPKAIRYWLEDPRRALARKEEPAPDLWTLLSSEEELYTIRAQRMAQEHAIQEAERRAILKAESERMVNELVPETYQTVDELRVAYKELQKAGISLTNTSYEMVTGTLREFAKGEWDGGQSTASSDNTFEG